MLKLACAALLIAAGAQPARAQIRDLDPETPIIAVTGSAQVRKPADWYDVTVGLRGDGNTQVEALRALATAQDSMRQGVASLEGVTRVEVRTRDARITETYTAECERDPRDRASRRPQDVCRPTGFNASSESAIRIRPANRVGAALSLAAERGAVSVRTQEVGVDDPGALRREAIEAAIRAARAQAEAAARAGGVTLGPLLRVVDSQARTVVSADDEVEAVVVSGSRVRAAVSLTLDPPPVTEDARVTAVFRLGR